MKTGESKILFSRKEIIFTEYDDFTTQTFIKAVLSEELKWSKKYFPMKKGWVDRKMQESVISIGIDIHNFGAYSEIRNVLTSLSWEETCNILHKFVWE